MPFAESNVSSEALQKTLVFEIALDLFLQRLQHARHRDQNRNPLASNGADDLAWFQAVLKNYRPAHELRKKNPQKLPEDVAQRQQVQKANRVDEAFVLEILLNLRLQRCHVRENIAMRDDNALGIRGRA